MTTPRTMDTVKRRAERAGELRRDQREAHEKAAAEVIRLRDAPEPEQPEGESGE